MLEETMKVAKDLKKEEGYEVNGARLEEACDLAVRLAPAIAEDFPGADKERLEDLTNAAVKIAMGD